MTTIEKAQEKDNQLIAEIGRISFIEAHGTSASETDINAYVAEKYNPDAVLADLRNPDNLYRIIYHNGIPAGYSKIIFDSTHPNLPSGKFTKLERLYLLKEFYSLKLGYELFNYNLELAKHNNQQGIWLFVWKGNHRAISFYQKTGFEIIGSYDFKITDNHSNPNHQMLLKF